MSRDRCTELLMTQQLRQVFTFLLLILILVSSIGVVVGEQYCPITKKTSIATFKSHSCCCNFGNDKSAKDNCCEFSQQYINQDTSSDSVTFSPSIQFALVVSKIFHLKERSFVCNRPYLSSQISTSPPGKPFGRGINIFYQVFLI